MGKVALQGLEFHAFHGLHPEEQRFGSRFVVDLELITPFEGLQDRILDTVDYASVYTKVRSLVTERRFDLIETLADSIADSLLETFRALESVTVRVHKPHAPLPGIFADVYVETFRCR